MNLHACNRMPTFAALLLVALFALFPAQRSALPALPAAGQAETVQSPADDAQIETRSSAEQVAYDDTPVLPMAPCWPARVVPRWPEPAPRHGAGTRPQPRLRPPSA